MFRDVYVDHFFYDVGDECCSLEESAKAGRLISDPGSLREAGFDRHHICHPDTSSYDLAARAVDRVRGELSGVGAIVYATSLPLNGNLGTSENFRATRDVKYLMDFPVSHLQADFGLSGAAVYGVNQLACTSLLAAMRMGRMILVTEPAVDKVLCVTADRFPEGALYEQAYNLISDGAAGCILTRERRGFRFVAGHSLTNGALAYASDDETVGSYFTYTHRMIKELLEREQMSVDDVSWIVSQNINLVTWRVLSSLLGCELTRVQFPTMQDVGHMISGDNVLNLQALDLEDRVRPGERVLLPMAGYGLNWQSLLLEKVSP